MSPAGEAKGPRPRRRLPRLLAVLPFCLTGALLIVLAVLLPAGLLWRGLLAVGALLLLAAGLVLALVLGPPAGRGKT